MNATASDSNGERLVTASTIADIAGVKPSAVSNWRKRFPDFPAPAGTAPSGGDLFALSDVENWLEVHPRGPKRQQRDLAEQVWAVAGRLRGKALAGDLIGVLAAAAALLHLARVRGHIPPQRQPTTEIAAWAHSEIRELIDERADLAAVFDPLLSVEPPSLGLLLDSFAPCETPEELAAVLDDVIERVSRYGEFRTPESVAELLAALAEPRGSVFDPAVGSGQFLISAAQAATDRVDLYGQELNESTWRLAQARLLLRDLEAEIQLGDSLTEDRLPELRADVVMCDPPAGARTADLSYAVGDPRWQLLGSLEPPPARAADFTWLAHVIHHLAPHGRGYVLLTAGSLFRGGPEARFRSELLRRGAVEAIIALPRGTDTTAGNVAFALWIVRQPTSEPSSVLLIDGTTGNRGLTRQLSSRLTEIVRMWRAHPHDFESTPGLATSVPVLDLLAGDAPLVPSRWLYEPGVIDAQALIARVGDAEGALEEAHTSLPPHAPRFALVPIDEPLARVRVRDLVDLRLARLLRATRIKTEQYSEAGPGLPVWLPGDIHDPWRRTEPRRYIAPSLVDARSITEPGDIVFTTIGGIRTRVDDEGGHVLGTSLQALRLRPNTFDPYAFAALLTSEANRRLLTGTTIPRVNVLELELPHFDLATGCRIGETLRRLEHELEIGNAVVARAEALRQSLVDALATGTVTIGDATSNE